MVTKQPSNAITRPFTDYIRPPPEVNSQGKSILVIGGSARAAATDAVAGGYCVTAMDHFGDADLKAVCNRWIHLSQTDHWPGLVPDRQMMIVPTGGFDWPVSSPQSHLGLVAFPAKSLFDAMRDPLLLAELASEVGVDFPPTWLPGGSPLPGDEKARDCFPVNRRPATVRHWLVKPRFSTGGLGIRSVGADLVAASQRLQPGEYLQQHVAGRPIGANFISRFGQGKYQVELLGIFAGLTYRRNHSHRWLYGGSIGPLASHDAVASGLQDRLTLLGNRIAERFELVGLFNVDLIAKHDRTLALLEINPRYSASMELMPTAGHLIDWHINAYQEIAGHKRADKTIHPQAASESAADQGSASHAPTQLGTMSELSFLPASGSTGNLACKRIIYATREVRFNLSTKDLNDSIRDLFEPGSTAITFHDIPSTDDIIPGGFPILTVIARSQANNTLAMAKKLMRQTRRIAARVRDVLL